MLQLVNSWTHPPIMELENGPIMKVTTLEGRLPWLLEVGADCIPSFYSSLFCVYRIHLHNMTTWPLMPDHLETTTLEHLGNVCGFHQQIVRASVNSSYIIYLTTCICKPADMFKRGFIQRSALQFLGSKYSNTDWEKKACRGEKWWLTMVLHCNQECVNSFNRR